ncbi:MAG: DUF4242 domain-containing protein [Pseudomonadota bacterium]
MSTERKQPAGRTAAVAQIAAVLATAGVGAPTTAAERPAPPQPKARLYLDVHELGPGKVDAAAVAQAHKKDLAVQGRHGVHFRAYWVDEKQGRVYCLAEAPSAEAAIATHREAHGLMPSRVREVTGDNQNWTPAPGMKLFLDRHELGPGKVTAKEVAAAHEKDLAVQGKHQAHFLNYWFDEGTGTVTCLVEAPSAEAAVATHKEAHGLLPQAIDEVVEGR